jgi:hypothetical protein
METARAATVVLATAAVLAGCGSTKKQSSATSGTATVASTRIDAPFIARVNAVCAGAAAGTPRFPYPNFDPVHPDVKLLPKVGAFFAKRQAIADAVPRQLLKLGQPATGQGTWAQMVVLAARDRAIADRQIKAAEASDVRGFVATVNEISQVSSRLGQLANEAGFPTNSPCSMIF